MNRRKQTTPKQRSTPDKVSDDMASGDEGQQQAALLTDSTIANTVDQRTSSERTVAMSPDANRSSLSNDGACCGVDKTLVLLSHQPEVSPAAAADEKDKSPGQKTEDHEITSRNIPVTQLDGGLEKESSSRVTSRRFQCDACGRLLSTSTSLERHMLTHTGQRPYPCPHCPICFTTNGNLLRHVKSCHETNPDASLLSMALESSSRPSFVPETKMVESPIPAFFFNLSLPNASYSGSVSGSVDDEDRDRQGGSHGSEADEKDSSKYKPFLCTLCDKVFSTRTNCERHIRNRHSESTYSRPELVKLIKFIPKNSADCHAICKYCKKDFVSQKMLKHHLRSPYSSCRRKPFACQLCEATFSTRNNCIRHISNLHPKHKSDYKKLIVLNAPMPIEEDFGDLDDDNSPPTMAILSPGVMSFSGRESIADMTDVMMESSVGDSGDESMFESYSPENYSIFSPPDSHYGSGYSDRVPGEDPLDLTMGPLDLSLKKRKTPEEIRSSPTSWFAREDRVKPAVPRGINKATKKMPLISVSSLMQERAVPLRMAMGNSISENVMIGGATSKAKEVVERPAKRPRPYICQYCGIGFTIRGNMYRHFRHKHPEHVSKRRQKKPQLTENAAKQIDETLDSVVGESSPPADKKASKKSVPGTYSSPIKEQWHSEVEDGAAVHGSHDGDAEFEDEDAQLRDLDNHDEREESGDKSESDGCVDLEIASTASDSAKQRANSYSMSPHVHACHECGRKFPWQSSLERHMYTHTGQKPYSCRWCSLKFSIKSNCERHCLRIHGKSFNNARKEKRIDGKTFRCPVCRESFAFKINCERHCLDAHQAHFDVTAELEEAVDQPRKKRKGGKTPVNQSINHSTTMCNFPCLQCHAVFLSKKDLDLHDQTSHSLDFDQDDASNSSFSGSLVVDA